MASKNFQQKKLLQYEYKRNIWKKKYQYLVPVATALQISIQKYNISQSTLPAATYFGKFLEGMNEIVIGSRTSFLIPGDWCLFFIFLIYITGKSAKDFTNGIGMQLLLRTKNASYFWNVKCLACIGNVFLYFFSAYSSIFLFCVWTSKSIKSVLKDSAIWNKEQIIIQFILPILAACVICIWQMIISMISNSLIGILIMSMLLVTSAYIKNWILIGNYLMKLRVQEMSNDGISYTQMSVLLVILLITGFFVGKNIMKRLDYIQAKGDL